MTVASLTLSWSEPGLTLLTGANGAGKSFVARALAAEVAGAALLSAESQQAFYEAQLAASESNFKEGADTSSKVSELLGAVGRAHPLCAAFRLGPLWDRGYTALSTGEARKVLLLQAVLRAPPLMVLDEPFEGLDVASRQELARAIVQVAARHHVLVVATFRAGELPLPAEAVREVIVLAHREITFRGTAAAFLAQAAPLRSAHAPPPVELGSFYPPLPPDVPLVRLVRGRVQYGDDVIFEGLDFSVAQGQHTLLEGPNGSGKSTLLELITGDHPQGYSNDLTLFGRRRGSGETVWDIKKNVGLVSARLHRDYRVGGSVEEVLMSGLHDSIGLYCQPEPSHRARAHAWLAWLGLGLVPTAAFRDLSFGQQRLVLIGRAVIKVPPLVVMDEPTAGLDPEARERALELIASLGTQAKSTVLMVTHRDDERHFWHERVGGAVLALRAR